MKKREEPGSTELALNKTRVSQTWAPQEDRDSATTGETRTQRPSLPASRGPGAKAGNELQS